MISNGMQFDSATIHLLANFAKFLEVLNRPELYQSVLKDTKEVLDRMDEATSKYKTLKAVEQALASAKEAEATAKEALAEALKKNKETTVEAAKDAERTKAKWDAYSDGLRLKAEAIKSAEAELAIKQNMISDQETNITKRLKFVDEKEYDLKVREKALEDKAVKLKALLG